MWEGPTGVGIIILGALGQSLEWKARKHNG